MELEKYSVFNFESNSSEYELLTNESHNQEALVDSWSHLNPNDEHAPTCGIFDKKQWPDGAHCRDFAFVSSNLKNNVDSMVVNEETDASDHQPFVISLKGN